MRQNNKTRRLEITKSLIDQTISLCRSHSSLNKIATIAGVSRGTLQHWRNQNAIPGTAMLDTVLNAAGHRLSLDTSKSPPSLPGGRPDLQRTDPYFVNDFALELYLRIQQANASLGRISLLCDFGGATLGRFYSRTNWHDMRLTGTVIIAELLNSKIKIIPKLSSKDISP